MGLEIVEIGIRIEEEFEITVADEDYESFIAVGDVYQFVLQKLSEKYQTPLTELSEQLTWKLVVKIVSDTISISENEIRANSRFKEDLMC